MSDWGRRKILRSLFPKATRVYIFAENESISPMNNMQRSLPAEDGCTCIHPALFFAHTATALYP